MSGLGWISFLIIGLIAGWVADRVMKQGHNLVMNLGVGVVGAYIGAFLFGFLGLSATNWVGAIIVATVGSIVLLWIVNMVRGRR